MENKILKEHMSYDEMNKISIWEALDIFEKAGFKIIISDEFIDIDFGINTGKRPNYVVHDVYFGDNYALLESTETGYNEVNLTKENVKNIIKELISEKN